MEKRTFKKSYFIGTVLMIFVFSGIFYAFKTTVSNSERNRKNPTETLLNVMGNANVEEVTRLIQDGADVNAVGDIGMTPLMLAAESQPNPEILLILIENGADVNATDHMARIPWTPLMLAAESQPNPEILRILIEKGADLNAVGYMGMTPLMLAARNNPNPEILRILLDNGADAAVLSREGENALYYANRNSALRGTDVYNILQEKTVENLKNATEVLLAVAQSASAEEVTRLIQEGADVNATNKWGMTPLIKAAAGN